jgi:hypothetical protein
LSDEHSRQTIEALSQVLLHETICDWWGVLLQTLNDHKMVDRQPMRLACVKQYDLEEGADYDHGR